MLSNKILLNFYIYFKNLVITIFYFRKKYFIKIKSNICNIFFIYGISLKIKINFFFFLIVFFKQ